MGNEKTKMEQQRGQEVLARLALSRRFNPEHEEAETGPEISPETRARRDDYRKNHVINWSKLDRD